jgi:hypothetical protein
MHGPHFFCPNDSTAPHPQDRITDALRSLCFRLLRPLVDFLWVFVHTRQKLLKYPFPLFL